MVLHLETQCLTRSYQNRLTLRKAFYPINHIDTEQLSPTSLTQVFEKMIIKFVPRLFFFGIKSEKKLMGAINSNTRRKEGPFDIFCCEFKEGPTETKSNNRNASPNLNKKWDLNIN